MEKPKKKRGRKSKKVVNKKVPNKKRGRKPKGGKIIKTKTLSKQKNEIIDEQNIILHLKCSVNDLIESEKYNLSNLNYNPVVNNIEGFSLDDKKYNMCEYTFEKMQEKSSQKIKTNKKYNKEVCKKLKQLQKQLHFNNVSDKKSDCFWCTYPFDNPTIYIPARIRKESIEVYGCFCCPECAVAYLNKENIDSSTRWERYALLNNLYGKTLNYEKNIKPSPDPFYTLEKYYGNLSIFEYRKLLTNSNILLVINKPLTKILPELHEEKADIKINCHSFHSINDKTEIFPSKNKNIKKEALSKNFNFFS